ncbi:GNAT family N-acetyltransferase [Streptomyces sp. MP131-18]|uniref:GNAT family N-acetyltransferase n=1 Tax=Streptomyces sp. MP131-18 TaxID=1857892 RepID=UPI0009D55C48|nr:GNAT family N-acetyltransferase [Streptomyces sp. MP131-18]ONK15507.1 putative ribosomal N-acetyltransferase YdaF [Streptomyces sp. MP131-18]
MTHRRDGGTCIPTSEPGLVLRELLAADAGEYVSLLAANREHLGRYADWDDERSSDPGWIGQQLAEVPSDGSVRFGLRLGGSLVGRVDLIATAASRYRIAYWLDERHTGRGLATAAARAAVAHAGDVRGARDVYAAVTGANRRGAAVLGRLGFAAAGEARGYRLFQRAFGPPPGPVPVPRPAARVLLVDDEGRLLLFSGRRDGTTYWYSAGGGLEPGESHEQAALRELREETGLTGVRLSGEVWRGRPVIARWGGVAHELRQRYFLARVPVCEIDTSGFDELERARVTGHRWWPQQELAATADVLRPAGLPGLLARLLAEGPPARPVLVDA